MPVANGHGRDPRAPPSPRVRCSAARMPRPIGIIMAVVAVLLTHIEIAAVTKPSPASMRAGEALTQAIERNDRAMRRSSP